MGSTDPVTAYAQAVVDGDVPAGTYHRLACARHLRDRERQRRKAFPYRFDVARATQVIRFFAQLTHYKGEWAGQPLVLAPWQQFIVGSLFGWLRTADNLRRFRVAYNEVPRKNGKSTMSAGIGIYLAFFDGEPGSETFCAATKRDQAKIIFTDAKRMVQRSPALKSRIGVFVGNLHRVETASKLEPLGADADSLDGLNPHGILIDELHAQKTRAVVDVLETATGARRQPLQFAITTAGYDRTSVCYQHHAYSVQVLEGTVTDDTWFAFIAAADEGDDWQQPATWAKANPNLGVSVKLDDLARQCHKAAHMPAEQNTFRRLQLNQWVEQAER